MIQPVSAQSPTASLLWALPFGPMEWELTPPAVQDYRKPQHQQSAQWQAQSAQLQQQVATLPGRVEQTSQPSSKPPSSDSPCNKPKRHKRTASGKRGGQKGHRGHGPTLLSPTAVHLIEPGPCPCGHGHLVSLSPYHTHQGSALPPLEMDIHHGVLQPGQWQGCGRPLKAQVPPEPQAGDGPRLTAWIGALAGIPRPSWRLVQDFCHSVLPIPISLSAVHQVINRGSQAILPHYEAMATWARQAPGGSIDETPWYCHTALQWLWTMTTDTVSLYLMHPNRSTEAFVALIEAWQGILGSDGYGV